MAYGPPAYDHTHAPACLQWPAARHSRYTGSYAARGSAPILVFGNTGDPDTPYADSVVLANVLANGHLVTWEGEGHTAYGRSNQCIIDAVDGWLVDGTMPSSGTVC
jgi:hypothetical protein